VREPLFTRWGRALDPDDVLPGYPRPQLGRDSFLSLNGWWDYAITPASAPPPTSYDGRILVPFSPESALSEVGRQLRPDERLTYRRHVEVPDGLVPAEGRLLLHFGAVDQTCVVRVDGVEVGANAGGYLPFSCDVTAALSSGNGELVVEVWDRSDGAEHASGKQRLHRGGIWYTAQSGIWQTVWLEAVPKVYVDGLDLVPHLVDGDAEVTVHSPTDTEATVRLAGRSTVVVTNHPTRIPVDDVRPWTPADPHLYDVEVTLGDDRVTSYFGMRSFGVGRDDHGTPRLLLNGAPYLPVGVLDQGYWPDGLLTAPSDEAMVHDITNMKRLGFTMLRKHLKVEPLRWYHHCDRLGMLVWQDIPNGGARYRTWAVTWPGRYPIRLDDRRWRKPLGRADPAGRATFESELRRTVHHLRNVPSLMTWAPFNEGWGQFDANRIADDVRALDPTRIVDHASGWHDQGGGDIRSLHDYGKRVRLPRKRDHRPVVLAEYGGRRLRIAGHAYDDDVAFGYGKESSADGLDEWLTRLHETLRDLVGAGLSATVYTQLCDVEDELNGLLTYDREVCKIDERRTRSVLTAILSELSAASPAGRG
jgi:beta-galactosidase/beta-glucuronidase